MDDDSYRSLTAGLSIPCLDEIWCGCDWLVLGHEWFQVKKIKKTGALPSETGFDERLLARDIGIVGDFRL